MTQRFLTSHPRFLSWTALLTALATLVSTTAALAGDGADSGSGSIIAIVGVGGAIGTAFVGIVVNRIVAKIGLIDQIREDQIRAEGILRTMTEAQKRDRDESDKRFSEHADRLGDQTERLARLEHRVDQIATSCAIRHNGALMAGVNFLSPPPSPHRAEP